MAPERAEAVRFKAVPVHTGLLLLAVGAAGGGLTTTTVVPAELAQPETVAVTEYVPALETVTPATKGF